MGLLTAFPRSVVEKQPVMISFRVDNIAAAVAGLAATVYAGSHYEKQGGTAVKYYLFGGQRVAMNRGGVLYYLAGDHLGTTSAVLCGQAAGCGGIPLGGKVAESRHHPYGTTRWSSGTSPTDYRFTGQRVEVGLGGIYHMGARFYDPQLARWLSADTLVPDPEMPQSLNRFSYVLGNPLELVDPTGHLGMPWWKAIRAAAQNAVSSARSWLSSRGEALAADVQAVVLAVEWLTETGPENQAFGPDEPLTQDVRHDPLISEFCDQWAAAGHPLPFSAPTTIDTRNGSVVSAVVGGAAAYARENAELGLALGGWGSNSVEGRVDAVGGILASFDNVTVSDAGDGLITFEVLNRMTWESATRIPGTNVWLIDSRSRSQAGPGGDTSQTFYWWDSVYVLDSCY